MCRMCDDPNLTFADMRAAMVDLIDRHGWMIMAVEPDTDYVGFAYTVGLTDLGAPELFLQAMPERDAARLLNVIAEDLIAGLVGPWDVVNDLERRQYLLCEPLQNPPLLAAFEFYGQARVSTLVVSPLTPGTGISPGTSAV